MRNNYQIVIARIALILLIAGIVIPLINNDKVALELLSILSYVLALILGLTSWQSRLGKIVSICALIMISIFSVAHISLASSEKKVQLSKQKYEEAQSKANKALEEVFMKIDIETSEDDKVPIEKLDRKEVHDISEAE